MTPTLVAIDKAIQLRRQSKARSLAQRAHDLEAAIAVISGCVVLWSLVSARLERWDVTAPIAFVLLGLAAANGPLSVVHLHLRSPDIRILGGNKPCSGAFLRCRRLASVPWTTTAADKARPLKGEPVEGRDVPRLTPPPPPACTEQPASGPLAMPPADRRSGGFEVRPRCPKG
jgi:hypothetical protein